MNWSWSTHPGRNCRYLDTEYFNDETPERQVAQAKGTCIDCPVQQQCLQTALENDERWGVWGGLATIERDRYKFGHMPIRRCHVCGVSFVSSRRRCGACSQPLRDVSAIEFLVGRGEQLKAMFADGLGDHRVAELMTDEFGQRITHWSIQHARARLGIRLADKKERADYYSVASVDLAESSGEGFTDLTHAERLELMRRWVRDEGTVTAFCHRYHSNARLTAGLYHEVVADKSVSA